MRPGQLTPENRALPIINACRCPCFNEAGAINPGKPPSVPRQHNEVVASMRPGQLTPENEDIRGIMNDRSERLQ